jgi:PKD repeat protein
MQTMSAILKRIGHFLLIIFAGVVSFLVPDLFSSCERFDYERVIIIETGPVIDISCISAEISGQLIDLGESDIIQHGHCWSEDANPTKDGSNISSLGSISSRGSFTSEITGLLPDTKYYVRAYATNSKGITTYGDTKSFATNADNSPKANFTASATAISIGQSVYFYDQSDNAPASWLWSFGDGESSTEQNPVHVFETTGNYTVELKASNDCGAHTASKPGYIKVQERFRDYRDGHVYRWVTIGNQVWMAENLAYLPDINPPEDYSPTIPLNYVYDYYDYNTDEAKALSNYSTYGVLYNWTAAMNGSSASSANPSGVQGICPEGWHLPSDDEWFDLIFYVGGNLEDPLEQS